ncbi:hypothetical protein PybrP1_000277 [[Pythium] brassicae (nom. inval.)]|nr:hypothetical protein PybrP1_000277 [[Pythium] brassicae (nom. inval.)]
MNVADERKRTQRPTRLEELDVAEEREKNVKARQDQSDTGGVKITGSKREVNNRRAVDASVTREKSPSKQQQQHRASASKVAVSAEASALPMKRPASAPVTSTGITATKAGARASLGGSSANASAANLRLQRAEAWQSIRGVGDGAHATKTSASKPRKPTLDTRRHLDCEAGKDDAVGDSDEGERADDAPARGHYDIFLQARKCEDLCLDLGLTLKHIRQMKKLYDANDMYCSYANGEITHAEFFFMINEEERPISKGVLNLGGVAPDQKFISFDQYTLCVVQFASFAKPELFQFVFDLYDDDQSGSLDEREFAKMSKELQSKQFCFPKNVETAVRMLGGGSNGARGIGSEDGLVDITQFMKFARIFPVAFYPIVNMQKNIRAATLGESYWSRVVARKMKIQSLVSHMRRNFGAIPELTARERILSFFSDDVVYVRKRASELYAAELKQRRRIGSAD